VKRRGLLMVVVSMSLAIGVALPAAWWASRPPTDVGTLDRFERGSRSRSVSPPAPSIVVGTHSGRLENAPVGATTPIAVRIGGVGVDAPVIPVGLELNGEMEIPDSVAQVGWYRLGAVPGRPGSAVLAGHVDSRSQGRGAFFSLGAVAPGAPVTIVDTRGAEHRFEVVARRQFPKDGLPADLFSNTGDARLALITCGGDFNRATRSYRDNVVVYAVAV
jgi:hypothetical protein